jgi:hypothetical protein
LPLCDGHDFGRLRTFGALNQRWRPSEAFGFTPPMIVAATEIQMPFDIRRENGIALRASHRRENRRRLLATRTAIGWISTLRTKLGGFRQKRRLLAWMRINERRL